MKRVSASIPNKLKVNQNDQIDLNQLRNNVQTNNDNLELKGVRVGSDDNVAFENLQQSTRLDENKSLFKSNFQIKWWPFFSLMRYASKWDICLICCGTICTVLSSWGIPTMNVIFGQVVNTFVRYESHFERDNSTHISNYTLAEDNENIMRQIPFIEHYCNQSTLGPEATDSELYDELTCKVRFLSFLLFAIGIVFFLCCYLCLISFELSAFHQLLTIKKKFFASILHKDIEWFDEMSSEKSSEIKSTEFSTRVSNDLKRIERGMNENLCLAIYFLSSAISNLFYAFYFGWKLALMVFSLTPLLIVSSSLLTKIQSTFVRKEMKSYSEAGAVATEIFSSIRTVFAFGGENKAIEQYDEKLVPATKSGYKRSFLTAFGNALTWGVIYIGFALCIWYGVHLITTEPNSGYDIGTIIIVFWCTSAVGWNLGYGAPYVESVQTACSVARQIYETIEKKSSINSDKLGKKHLANNYPANIEFRGVHFSYPSRPDVKIINGLNLDIQDGEVVALVGSSGCGKSTILQLLQRFYDPNAGEIRLGGVNICDLNVTWLREQFGVVGQEPVLFDSTIADNILLGMSNSKLSLVTIDQIKEAAKEANAHEFIQRLPEGYHSHVGGSQLSGGQKQRIAIARALIKKPKILLLDEATSALDLQSERVVQMALDRASQGRTTIIVAHRLSTIINANRIICLEGGKVVEMGTHSELMALKSTYYNLVTAQTKQDLISNEQYLSSNLVEDCKFISSRKRSEGISISTSIRSKEMEINDIGQCMEETESYDQYAQWRVIRLIFRSRISASLGVICSFLFGLCVPMYAYIFGNFVNIFTHAPNSLSNNETNHEEYLQDESVKYSIQFIGLAVFAFTCCFLQLAFFSIASQKLTTYLRLLAFGAIVYHDVSWFDKKENHVGNLCSRLASDPNEIQSATGPRIAMFCQAISTLLVSIAFGFYTNWELSLVTVVFVPIIAISSTAMASIIGQQTSKEKESNEKAAKIGQEAIRSIRTIVSLNKEQFYAQYYSITLDQNVKQIKVKYHKKAVSIAIAHCAPLIAYATTFLYGGYLIADHKLSSGNFFQVIEAIIFGVIVFGQSCIFSSDYQNAKTAAVNIFRLIDTVVKERKNVELDYELQRCKGKIIFRDVYFSYPNRRTVTILNGLSFKVKPGEKVALVGFSGCGKSTVIQLLERFYEPSSGSIYLDGTNINELNINWLRSQISLVSQEPLLFNCTIKENIAYGDNTRKDVPIEDIIEVCQKVSINDFIMSLPEKYETKVGENGCLLSGGQKQRIAIARALLRNPPILLLDEATSALDSNSEKQILEAIDCASTGRTCIIIAHRLSTIENVDTIFYIDKGVIVEQGTHQELLEKQGSYWNLYNLQSCNISE